VSYLTYENQTVQQWKLLFLITAIILLISGMTFLICSDSNVQYWNKYGIDSEIEKDDLECNNLALIKTGKPVKNDDLSD
jgi:hypothetical protein